MSFYKIRGGNQLHGKIKISGSKNAALPIIASSLLTKEDIILYNVPVLQDILMMKKLLEELGKKVELSNNRMIIVEKRPVETTPPYEIFEKMRASITVLGPLLARYQKADMFLPGGCSIGHRPVDLHIKAMEQLGASIVVSDTGQVIAKTDGLVGAEISLLSSNGVTVLGTANALMAATLARGTTVIDPSALEPEVGDLGSLLMKMGAKIEGLNTSILTVHGVTQLGGAEHTVIPDRIEAGTFITMVGSTGGEIVLENVNIAHLEYVINLVKQMGIQVIEESETSLRIISKGELKAVDIVTEPYPGFPTDMQAQFMVLLTQSKGKSEVHEKIFENRLQHVEELNKLGAQIIIKKDNTVLVEGSSHFEGTFLNASDLRAGAGLVIAGLATHGETIVNNIFHTDRGYENFEEKISQIGGNIQRLTS